MRGEHGTRRTRPHPPRGSSPHARGTPRTHCRVEGRNGIIPACAGNTNYSTRTCRVGRDHPRMRGEHHAAALSPTHSRGSSPHARGTHTPYPRPMRPRGIIPACAGNTVLDDRVGGDVGDHPRMRGEHTAGSAIWAACRGSSPHARGTQVHPHTRPLAEGIIPACAGNTDVTRMAWGACWDHPRMRGEHRRFRQDVPCGTGSSPHARGTQNPKPHISTEQGIIPACAGNTSCIHLKDWLPRDHPRMRGEHPLSEGDVDLRGDHPRMRGEHPRPSPWLPSSRGSSPHARGTLVGGAGLDAGDGIIPACAGNTCRCCGTAG